LPVNPKQAFGAVKPMLHLVPPALVLYASLAARDGAIDKAYGPLNWRETPVLASTYLNAMERHLMDLKYCNDFTSDMGIPSISGLIMSAAIYVDALECGTLVDDRKPGPSAKIIDRLAAEQKLRARAWERTKSGEPFIDALRNVQPQDKK
jgi:hypothetical protein